MNHIFTDHDEDCHLLLMRRPPSIRIPDISWSFKFTQRKATINITELFFMKSHKIFITIITWQGKHARGCEANKFFHACAVESPESEKMMFAKWKELLRPFHEKLSRAMNLVKGVRTRKFFHCQVTWDPCAITPGWPLIVFVVIQFSKLYFLSSGSFRY